DPLRWRPILVRALCLAILVIVAFGAAEAQVRDRLSRIDRIDRAARVDSIRRATEADRLTQRAIERREAQAAANDQQVRQPGDPLLSDQRLTRMRDGFVARR